MTEPDSGSRRGPMIEVIVVLLLLAMTFAAIAASDVSASGSYMFWTVLVVLFAATDLATDRLHGDHEVTHLPSILGILLHWIGVVAAVQLIFVFVSSGRIANADTGLTNGVLLALGTFTAGVRGNWRLLVIGVTLGLATIGVAVVEEYLWILLLLAVLATAVLLLGARRGWRLRARPGGT